MNNQLPVYAQFEDIESEIKRLLLTANHSVRICVAWINGQIYGPIFQRLLEKGVNVELICNNDFNNAKTAIHLPPGIKCYPIQARLSSALMHNKFCVIDEEIVLTGSYNWSRSASASFENILVVKSNFSLVKSFLHEFHDLIHFFHNSQYYRLQRCPLCRSYQFNLGIFGSESGTYNESKVSIWSVCTVNHHAFHIGEHFEQFIQSQLGQDDEYEYDYDASSKEAMLQEYQRERRRIEEIQQYFIVRRTIAIHAFGTVAMDNFNAHNKFGEHEEYSVHIHWRDMYYRKLIPSQLHDDGAGVEAIISEHC